MSNTLGILGGGISPIPNPAKIQNHHRGAGAICPKQGARKYAEKRVIYGGFRREKGGQNGEFGAPKVGKKPLFCAREEWLAGEEGFSGQERTLCPRVPAPRKSPWE